MDVDGLQVTENQKQSMTQYCLPTVYLLKVPKDF